MVVTVPADLRLRKIIDLMASFVAADGEAFEQTIKMRSQKTHCTLRNSLYSTNDTYSPNDIYTVTLYTLRLLALSNLAYLTLT